MKIHKCNSCGHAVYFHNTQCVRCQSSLAFDNDLMSMRTLSSTTDRLCKNGIDHQACNWFASAGSDFGYCFACDLNRTVPDLTIKRNLELWRKVQSEKNHLLYSLLRLNLPVIGMHIESDTGLAFDILNNNATPDHVVTGHARGVITLEIGEADDAYREKIRSAMGEPYRTLLGHFRHESAHYYWDQLVIGSRWLQPVRDLFGDERTNYQQALKAHYKSGPPTDWASRYISAYASCHPWEDFAETWAHYFHIIDTLETANEFGLSLDPATGLALSLDNTPELDPYQCTDIDLLIKRWSPISVALNMLNHSLGQTDAYPFVLNALTISKLNLIHRIISTQRPDSIHKQGDTA